MFRQKRALFQGQLQKAVTGTQFVVFFFLSERILSVTFYGLHHRDGGCGFTIAVGAAGVQFSGPLQTVYI